MNSAAFREALPEALNALGLTLSPQACHQLLAHLDLIAKWNRVYNLTAVREPAEMFTHHLLDSLAAVRPLARHLHSLADAALPRTEASPETVAAPSEFHVLDVGAGAGLPGVSLAIALPEMLAQGSVDGATARSVRVTCVDAVAKKAGFIRQVGAELTLKNLQTLHGRIESLALTPVDVITCRAFASLSDIVQLTQQHLAPGGVWMALKGVVPHDEMQALPDVVEVFHVEPLHVPQLDAQRCLVWMRLRRES